MAFYWAAWGLTIVLVAVVGGLIVGAVWLAVETHRLKREVAEQRARLVAKINAVLAGRPSTAGPQHRSVCVSQQTGLTDEQAQMEVEALRRTRVPGCLCGRFPASSPPS